MPRIPVTAVRWIRDEPQPGLVECRLVDADGNEHVLVDKCAIFDAEDRLRADAAYPIELLVDCRVIDDHGETLTIELAHSIYSTEDRTTFRVPRAVVR